MNEPSETTIHLLKIATAAVHALRSYQYGNVATELAKEAADALEAAIEAAARQSVQE